MAEELDVQRTQKLRLVVTLNEAGKWDVEFTGLWTPPFISRAQRAITLYHTAYRNAMFRTKAGHKRAAKQAETQEKIKARTQKATTNAEQTNEAKLKLLDQGVSNARTRGSEIGRPGSISEGERTGKNARDVEHKT